MLTLSYATSDLAAYTSEAQAEQRDERPNGAIDRTKYKTKLCRNYVNGQECPYGDRCVFAHGESEKSGPPASSVMYRTTSAASVIPILPVVRHAVYVTAMPATADPAPEGLAPQGSFVDAQADDASSTTYNTPASQGLQTPLQGNLMPMELPPMPSLSRGDGQALDEQSQASRSPPPPVHYRYEPYALSGVTTVAVLQTGPASSADSSHNTLSDCGESDRVSSYSPAPFEGTADAASS